MTDFNASETFSSQEILDAALDALEANATDDNFKVNVTTPDNADLLVTIQFSIPSDRHSFDSVQGLTDLVTAELASREEEALKAEIAELKAAIAVKKVNIAGQEADITRLKATIARLQK